MKRLFTCALVYIAIALTSTAEKPRSPVTDLSFVRLTAGLHEPSFEGGRTDFAMVDINNNGFVDILSIGDHGSPFINSTQHGVMVWFNDGQGNFSLHMEGNFGYGGIAVGDVNNDGLQDIAFGMHHNYDTGDLGGQLIEVALGDGTGMNWTAWNEGLATNGETWGMFGTDLGDVNNNGLLDLVSIAFGCCAGFHVYLNQGDGSWTPSFGMLGNNSDNLIRFADLNNNGHLDFVAGHALGTAFFGDGEGNFVKNDTGLPALGEFDYFMGVSVGDVNNDGSHGIAFTNFSGAVKVYEFDAVSESWVDFSGNLPTSGPWVLTQLWDMNANGFTDLAAFGGGTIQIWFGDGEGNWTPAVTFNTEGTPGNARAFTTGGDLTGNGHADIVLLSNEGDFWWNYMNELYVFAETTEPEELWIQNLYPKGHETFHPGAARFIHWASAVPGNTGSHVKLEISPYGAEGPWLTVADSLPNNGRHQWHIPHYGSDQVHLKLTVFTNDESASIVSAAPFAILGETPVYNIMAVPNDPDFGSITGSGEYMHGDEVTLEALPGQACHFVHWTEDDEVVMDGDVPVGSVYTFTAEEDRTLVGHFALNVYTIFAQAGENGSIFPEGEIDVTHATDQVFDIVPDNGFLVGYVEVDGVPIDLSSDGGWDAAASQYTFEAVTGDHTISAGFVQDETSVSDTGLASWRVYPNPASDILWVVFNHRSSGEAQVMIHDQNGRAVRQRSVTQPGLQRLAMSINDLQPGVYTVSIRSNEGLVVRKVVVGL